MDGVSVNKGIAVDSAVSARAGSEGTNRPIKNRSTRRIFADRMIHGIPHAERAGS